MYNEEESLPELHSWIKRVVSEHGYSYEIVFVDDGSTDKSWEVVKELKAQDPNIVAIRFNKNYGKSAGLHIGFGAAEAEVVFTMDADLQDSPDEIPEMRRMVIEEGWDIVSGWKKKRHDPISKTIPTKLYNWATRKMSGIHLHDFNCGLKAYRYEVIKNVEIHGEMHRYIPVIAKKEGYSRITEKVVAHQARKYGVTKFGLERFINGFLDLLTISFLGRFGKRPMHIFGLVGTLMFIFGFIVSAWLGAQKLYYLANDIPAKLVVTQAGFFIALTAMVIGAQLFIAGFLGELVLRNSAVRNEYKIREKL